MTRDEAIKALETNYCGYRDYCQVYPDYCVKDKCEIYMAIEALSADVETHDLHTDTHGVCLDLISRADAIEAVAQQWLFEASVESPHVNDDDIVEYRQLAEELLADIPSARPTEEYDDYEHATLVDIKEPLKARPTGEWKPTVTGTHGRFMEFKGYECSNCGYFPFTSHVADYNFCPNCGADMRGEKE